MNLRSASNSLTLIVPAFRLVANLEALSWIGLLAGMSFKYVVPGGSELGHSLVALFGAVHGALVIAYVALAGVSALRLRWSFGTLALAFAATVPPFATVVFDRWAERRGLYEPVPANSEGR